MPVAEDESTPVSVANILEAVASRAAAVTAETAGYLVLLALREAAPRGQLARPECLVVDCDGAVSLTPGAGSGSLAETEEQLRQLLRQFLRFVGSAGPALAAIGGLGVEGETPLEVELLSALVPLNEAAARRGVARLWRQTLRWRREGSTLLAAPPPEPVAVALSPSPSPSLSVEDTALCCDLSGRRSDLSDLIARYLSEPHSEAVLTYRLRQCVGLNH